MEVSILARKDRISLDNGMDLRLLSAMEVLEARRESEELTRGDWERALCSNACLLAKALERSEDKTAVFSGGVEVLNGSTDMDACRKALRYARELNLKTIGASDAHVEKQIGKYVTWLPEKVDTLPDFIAQLHACEPKPAIWNGIGYDIWSEV